MPNISHLKVCKKCKNVFSDSVAGETSTDTPCPICHLSSSEAVTSG